MIESIGSIPPAETSLDDDSMSRGRPAPSPSTSVLEASFSAHGGTTHRDRVYEAGALRLRLPRGPHCEAIVVNTGGGIVGGDRLRLDVTLGPDATVTMTNVAAEKVYRSAGPFATIDTRLDLASGARLDWLPQETILFDAARLRRAFEVTMDGAASLLAAEVVVFGRLASDEPAIHGAFRDRWRVRRDGRLVFADDTRLDGAIGATLDRPALGGGARAAALILLAAPGVAQPVEPLRERLAPFFDAGVESGVSARDGILVARLLARSPERLRVAMVAALAVLRTAPPPRVWA